VAAVPSNTTARQAAAAGQLSGYTYNKRGRRQQQGGLSGYSQTVSLSGYTCDVSGAAAAGHPVRLHMRRKRKAWANTDRA